MAELTDDELFEIEREAVRNAPEPPYPAAARRALYKAGRREIIDALYGLSGGLTTNGSPELWAWLEEYGLSQMSGLGSLLRCLAATRDWIEPGAAAYRRICTEPPLSCGCPPEHHDEAIRRAADPAERKALLARLTQESIELGTYGSRVAHEHTEES